MRARWLAPCHAKTPHWGAEIKVLRSGGWLFVGYASDDNEASAVKWARECLLRLGFKNPRVSPSQKAARWEVRA